MIGAKQIQEKKILQLVKMIGSGVMEFGYPLGAKRKDGNECPDRIRESGKAVETSAAPASSSNEVDGLRKTWRKKTNPISYYNKAKDTS